MAIKQIDGNRTLRIHSRSRLRNKKDFAFSIDRLEVFYYPEGFYLMVERRGARNVREAHNWDKALIWNR